MKLMKNKKNCFWRLLRDNYLKMYLDDQKTVFFLIINFLKKKNKNPKNMKWLIKQLWKINN